MIRVSPEYDLEKINALCAENGIHPEENALCYLAYTDGRLCGICLFKLTADGGRIMTLRSVGDGNDREALYLAGRACLEFTERTGGDEAYFEENDRELAEKLGFKEREGRLCLDLRGIFGGCCEGCRAAETK